MIIIEGHNLALRHVPNGIFGPSLDNVDWLRSSYPLEADASYPFNLFHEVLLLRLVEE